jgi:hypothetical protein
MHLPGIKETGMCNPALCGILPAVVLDFAIAVGKGGFLHGGFYILLRRNGTGSL